MMMGLFRHPKYRPPHAAHVAAVNSPMLRLEGLRWSAPTATWPSPCLKEMRRHPVGRAGRRPHGRRPFLCLSHAQVVQGQHTPSLRHAVRPPDWTGDTSLLSSSGMMMRFSCACLMVPCGPGCLFPPPALDMTDWWGSLANAADKERLTVMTCLVLVVGV